MSRIAEAIALGSNASYVYTYPPPRTYAPWQGDPARIRFSPEIGVYVHIPFCRQRCTFCGYLTAITDADGQDAYVEALLHEIRLHGHVLAASIVRTVNFGGGTPSLLTPAQFDRIMDALEAANSRLRETATEISIEATPESVLDGRVAAFRARGLTRVSLGIQSFRDAEILAANRQNPAEVSVQSLRTLRELGIPDICADLMYGLEGQTMASWRMSVERLIVHQPTTIELYNTVTLPDTAHERRGGFRMDAAERRSAGAFARERLLDAGYRQDCHVRFALPGGGYRQQADAFAGFGALGFGVAARSCAEGIHLRNPFMGGDGRRAVASYLDLVRSGRVPWVDAFAFTEDERRRKGIIGGIENLDLAAFAAVHGIGFAEAFPEEHADLLRLGLATTDGSAFRLTPDGLTLRDAIAHAFFSDDVRTRSARTRRRPLPILARPA